MNLARLISLEFFPFSHALGLFVLRVSLGLTMLFNHGWAKLKNFSQLSDKFPDPLSFGSATSLSLAIFAEVACSILLVFGIITRIAVLPLMATMAVAFIAIHKMQLAPQPAPPGSGELALVYLVSFTALFIAGPGAFSLDEWRRTRTAAPAA